MMKLKRKNLWFLILQHSLRLNVFISFLRKLLRLSTI